MFLPKINLVIGVQLKYIAKSPINCELDDVTGAIIVSQSPGAFLTLAPFKGSESI